MRAQIEAWAVVFQSGNFILSVTEEGARALFDREWNLSVGKTGYDVPVRISHLQEALDNDQLF